MSVSSVAESQPRHQQAEGASQAPFPRQRALPVSRYVAAKNSLDRLAAFVLLIPALPVIGALLVLVRATSKGSPLFRQVRVGCNGARFEMLKIRTMRCDAEAAGAQWSTGAADPRVTTVGKVIRRLHMDEFPQLFNVVRGHMSLVGPRPERPEFVEVLSPAIPGYAKRHSVRPGITGLAQINLPPDTDLESARRKLDLDLHYIQHASLALDLRLLACTALRLFGLRGDRLLRLTGVRRLPAAVPHNPSIVDANSNQPLTPELIAQCAMFAAGGVAVGGGDAHDGGTDDDALSLSHMANGRKAK